MNQIGKLGDQVSEVRCQKSDLDGEPLLPSWASVEISSHFPLLPLRAPVEYLGDGHC